LDPGEVPVAALELLQLRLLADPEDPEREEAHQVLVLDLAVPAGHAAHSQHPIWQGLGSEGAVLDVGDLAPNLLIY
jgi:hypothetical protein